MGCIDKTAERTKGGNESEGGPKEGTSSQALYKSEKRQRQRQRQKLAFSVSHPRTFVECLCTMEFRSAKVVYGGVQGGRFEVLATGRQS